MNWENKLCSTEFGNCQNAAMYIVGCGSVLGASDDIHFYEGCLFLKILKEHEIGIYFAIR